MNLKLDHTGMRFKITADELAQLQDGKHLKEVLQIGPQRLAIIIDPAGRDDEFGAGYSDGMIWLLLSATKINELATLGRSREGLEQEQDGLVLSLQVDFRTQKRQRA